MLLVENPEMIYVFVHVSSYTDMRSNVNYLFCFKKIVSQNKGSLVG